VIALSDEPTPAAGATPGSRKSSVSVSARGQFHRDEDIGLREHVLVHDGRALRDEPWDEAAHAAAAHDFLDVTQKTFPAFDRPLRRPQIRLVEHKVQRLLVCLVEGFGKCGHEAPACGIAAEIGEIEDAGECFFCDKPAERTAHFGGDWHIGVFPAEYHDRIAGRAAVGTCTQPPPTRRADQRSPPARRYRAVVSTKPLAA